MKVLYAVVIAAIAIACASIQPARVQVGDICYRCHRTIVDLKLAGELLDQFKAPFPFRTAGCLAKYVKAHPDQQVTAVFVTDYRTGHMLPADEAWFVSTTLTQPDGGKTEDDYLAFRSRNDAASLKGDKAVLLRWTQVVAGASAN